MISGKRSSTAAVVIPGIACGLLLAGLVLDLPARDDQSGRPDPSLERKLSMAESQHEIVMLLLRKKDFAQAAMEADKIFQMDWPASEESRLLKDMLAFTAEFQKHAQPAIGLQLLEKNFRIFKSPKSQAALYKEMGYLNKKLGNDDKALECFRKAQQLEKSTP